MSARSDWKTFESERAPALSHYLTKTFSKEMALKKEGKCPFCAEEVDPANFRDDLSREEFRISGLCQKCQDETFG